MLFIYILVADSCRSWEIREIQEIWEPRRSANFGLCLLAPLIKMN